MKRFATLAAFVFVLGSSGPAMAECTSPNCASEPPSYNNSAGVRRQDRGSSRDSSIAVDGGSARQLRLLPRGTGQDVIDRAVRRLGRGD